MLCAFFAATYLHKVDVLFAWLRYRKAHGCSEVRLYLEIVDQFLVKKILHTVNHQHKTNFSTVNSRMLVGTFVLALDSRRLCFAEPPEVLHFCSHSTVAAAWFD